ncbi:MAG: signal peptide peptidase SppA [Candidatus Manganitrophaceae bacterium]|nr:MAG: signal peptide peptidase SppA [Candidatus Manganitrophaceae bacterium]
MRSRFFFTNTLTMILGIGISMLLSGCIRNYITLFPQPGPVKENVVDGSGEDKVLLLDIAGVISEEKPDGLIEKPDMVARIKEELKKAEGDKAVKAIVLRINSPGGTVTASDIIYHEISAFKERTGRKVIASIGDVGASGGYYIAMAADRVLAHPTAVTGSIGVILLHVNLQGLMEKVGIGAEAIKSGAHKDMGIPTKPLAPEDRELFQSMINSMYDRFLQVVSQGRKGLAAERIKTLADGRIYTAPQAKEAGLIDDIGYLDQAIDLAKSEAGIKQAKVILYSQPSAYNNNIYSQAVQKEENPFATWGVDPKRLLQGGAPKFLYLWMP